MTGKEKHRLKWLPVGTDAETVARYVAILDMPEAERELIVAAMTAADYELYNEIETARAMYVPPVDRNPGSITPDKQKAYPERYGWKP